MIDVKSFLPDSYAPGENLASCLQRAIDEASAKRTPLFFPSGDYYSGTLYLRNDTHLILDDGATLYGVGDISAYGNDTHYNHYMNETWLDRCFLYAQNCGNITIEGGTIDGQRRLFPEMAQSRPMLLRFVDCHDIRIRNILLREPASWTSAYISCSDIFFTGVRVSSHDSINGDGADFDCCQRVVISDCIFDTGDDSICLQASLDDGVCSDVTVTNCVFRSKWAVSRIGTASRGTIRNVAFSNCVARDVQCSGFKIQAGEGGTISDMSFSNMVFSDVARPVFITVNRHRFTIGAPDPLPCTASIRRLNFSNFICRHSPEHGFDPDTGFLLIGSPELELRDIVFDNIDYTLTGGGKMPDAPFPDWNGARPEFHHFTGTLPSCAFYARHAKNIRVRNMRVHLLQPDERPFAVSDECENVSIDIEDFS